MGGHARRRTRRRRTVLSRTSGWMCLQPNVGDGAGVLWGWMGLIRVIINKKPFLTERCVCPNWEDFVVVMKHLITTLGATFVSGVVLVAVKIKFVRYIFRVSVGLSLLTQTVILCDEFTTLLRLPLLLILIGEEDKDWSWRESSISKSSKLINLSWL